MTEPQHPQTERPDPDQSPAGEPPAGEPPADEPGERIGVSPDPEAPPSAQTPTPDRPASDPPASDRSAAEPAERAKGLTAAGRVRTTRAGGMWVATVASALLLVVMLIFIVQNSDSVTLRFLGWDGRLPLAVALLLAAVIGVLLVAVPGTVRIWQLRRALVANEQRRRRRR